MFKGPRPPCSRVSIRSGAKLVINPEQLYCTRLHVGQPANRFSVTITLSAGKCQLISASLVIDGIYRRERLQMCTFIPLWMIQKNMEDKFCHLVICPTQFTFALSFGEYCSCFAGSKIHRNTSRYCKEQNEIIRNNHQDK